MYKIKKDVGTSANVYLHNTDTMAEINLGPSTPTMCELLKSDDYTFEPDDAAGTISFIEKWDLPISVRNAYLLAKLAMPIKKPIRSKAARPKKEDAPKHTRPLVDVLDIIYGLD